MTAIDPRALRDAFGAFMTGVTVVTTHDGTGNPLGFTANSFTSVSLDPPLLLVCLANSSRNYQAFTQGRGFAVNILAEDQKDISNTFARPSEDRFRDLHWWPGPHGAPVIGDVSAWFDCALHQIIEAGDHVILLGRVEAFDTSPASGLGYARGAYVRPQVETKALDRIEAGVEVRVSALIRQGERVLLVNDREGGLTLPEVKVGAEGVSAALARLLAATGLNAQPGFLYAVYEDTARSCQHITFHCDAEGEAPALGAFTELVPSTLMDLADPATCQMLKRFVEEARIGSFGVYYGNQTSGEVRGVFAGS
ncbi:flavin reductase family protein [Thioclava sp. GXIMD4216]|uniref:flavin reductase family protein n=1 Tax=Thioclava sp. GXIMD4216 TaxID=3131929 RepID=UPI0030CAB318